MMLYYLLKCSGRELFLSDASLFVDDAEAYDKYHRQPESDETEQNVSFFSMPVFRCIVLIPFFWIWFEAVI